MPPIDVPYEALRPVAHHGAPELASRRHAQPADRPAIAQQEDGHEPPAGLGPVRVDPFELAAASDAFGGPQRL